MTYSELGTEVDKLKQLRAQVAVINFLDADKETFRTELITIADALIAIDFRVSFDPFLPDEYMTSVRNIKWWLSDLLDSNAYCLCPEMSYCIERMIKRWENHGQPRNVVFTLGDFAIRKCKRDIVSKQIAFLYTLQLKTGITLTKEPVFVFVPEQFKDDLLSCVLLFHEVGHFVVNDNFLIDMVYMDIMPKLKASKTSRLRRDYFPWLLGVELSTIPDWELKTRNHISEYISDVFGSQYAHEHIMCFISHKRAKMPNDDNLTHPSYNCRKRVVDNFMEYCRTGRTKDVLINSMITFLPQLSKFISTFTEAELTSPNLQFNDEEQMFSVFAPAWGLVMREVARNKIPRVNEATYMQICAMPIFQTLNANIRNAIAQLMLLNP